MTDSDLYSLLRTQKVMKLIEAYHAPLDRTIKRIFEENLSSSDFKFIDVSDRRITKRYITCSYFGESLRDAITDLENEHPIEITFNPTPEGGYEISLEYKKEVEIIVE